MIKELEVYANVFNKPFNIKIVNEYEFYKEFLYHLYHEKLQCAAGKCYHKMM